MAVARAVGKHDAKPVANATDIRKTMKTKTYDLKDASFNVQVADDAAIMALTPEQRVALVASGLQNWGYRAGAKKANDGKTFTLADVAADILAVKVKDGDPNKDDKEQASDLMQLYRIDAAKVEITDEMREEDEWPGDNSFRLDICRERFERFVDKKTKELRFDWADTSYNSGNIAEFCRALRLARLRNARKANDLG